MTESDSKPAAGVNFFKNFNRVVGAAFLAIMVLVLGFFFAANQRQTHARVGQHSGTRGAAQSVH